LLKKVLTLAFAAAMCTLRAQPPVSGPYKLSATAELVLLDVSVQDPAGDHVWDLKKEDFKVFEDGKPQTITHFASGDVPVTVGLVIDTSGSMRPKYAQVMTAAMSFIRSSNPRDEVFVVNFGDRVFPALPPTIPFSSSVRQLRDALSMATPEGRTALNDAIVFSLEHLQMGTREKKALLLISDGGDNSSTHNSKEVLRIVQQSSATIYTVGIFDPSDPDRNPALLKRLAQISGGQAYFPSALSEIDDVCRQIAGDIRTRYTIGYVPVRLGEAGSTRKIRVIAETPEGRKFAVRTRTSYELPPVAKSGP
jgi:VWFA-related protein